MRRFRLPPQILRLVLLALAIVGSYLVARSFLVPPSFGEYGWYRGDALNLIASRDPVFAGKKACDECHSDILHNLAADAHKTLSCEGCHGVCQEHAIIRTSCPTRPPAVTASGVTKPIRPGRPGSSKSSSKITTGPNALNVTCRINPPKPMKNQISRRGSLLRMGAAFLGLLTLSAARAAKAAVQNVFVSTSAPKGYDPTKHKWLMCIDANKCIGCGLCAEACKKENDVPEGPYYRTWIERYIITKPKPGSGANPRRDAGGFSRTAGCTAFPEPSGAEGPDPAFVLRAQAVQPVRTFALRPGLPGRRDVSTRRTARC